MLAQKLDKNGIRLEHSRAGVLGPKSMCTQAATLTSEQPAMVAGNPAKPTKLSAVVCMQEHASSYVHCRRLAAPHFRHQAFWPLPMAPTLQVPLPVAGAQHLKSMLPASDGQPPV